jgi:aldehyde dehydrogenase (NAD+)
MGRVETTESAAQVTDRLRAAFGTGRTRPHHWRRDQLQALIRLLDAESDALAAALRADLGKCATEALETEIGFVRREAEHTLRHLERWLEPRHVAVPAVLHPGKAWIQREPLGVVLIIGAWNYPVQLTLGPLAGALAAGNCAVVKPSEISARTSALLARLLPRYLDPEAVAVTEGAVPETTALLEQRFDHILYTGNGAVGRIVMGAAAKHLTPVTLELGGKNPAVVETGVNLAVAARRLVWGRFLNAGQTCVAPDYVLAIGDAAAALEPHLASAVTEMYGADPAASPDYGRIVTTRHFDRLVPMLGDGRIVTGGQHDRNSRYIAPTVLADVDPGAPVMREEIFGPVLPVIAVPDLDKAIAFINERDKPLALYAFTHEDATKRRLLAETSSGVVCFGLPVAHTAIPGLPFGGVGESGLGHYHGEYSIDTFSHWKPVVDKPLFPDTWRVAYPPFTPAKQAMMRRLA